MQTLTIDVSTLEVATALYGKLVDFHPEIIDGEDGGWQVRVSLRAGDGQTIAVLNAIEDHVTAWNDSARVGLGGRTYTLEPL